MRPDMLLLLLLLLLMMMMMMMRGRAGDIRRWMTCLMTTIVLAVSTPQLRCSDLRLAQTCTMKFTHPFQGRIYGKCFGNSRV